MRFGDRRFTWSFISRRFWGMNRMDIQQIALGIGIEKKLPIERVAASREGLRQNLAGGNFVSSDFHVGVVDQGTRCDAKGNRRVSVVAQLLTNQLHRLRDGALFYWNADR